ncbi:hypothetical protein V6D40_02730 [Corynebacterium sp. Q4381]|uniref:hypothetical protein n=1 Tax=Corynebacterium sp. Marseille-Q4381 TaxID=3121597 RepID=UPI002FE5E0F8
MVTTTINSASQDPWTLTINAQVHATLSLMDATPGVTPAQRSQARSLAGDIRTLLARSTGLNLDAFRAVARGINGARRAVNARPGYLPQAESSRSWFDREGISLRERLDAKKEERHFQKRKRVADRIDQCCACIETIRAAAAKAVELFLDTAKRLLQLVGAFPFPKLGSMAAELVIKALHAARAAVSDHNDAVEQCLEEIADNIDDAADEQPAAPVNYECDCACADDAPKRKPGGVGTAPAGNPAAPGTAAAETTAVSHTPEDVKPVGATASSSTASAGAVPTTPASAPPTAAAPAPAPAAPSAAGSASPVLDGVRAGDRPPAARQQPGATPTARRCRTAESSPATAASDSAQPQQPKQPKVEFDYEVPGEQNAGLETVTCTVAETMTLPSAAGESDPARLIGTPLGRLGAVAVLGGVGFLAYSLYEAAQAHCACECCTSTGGGDPVPSPAPAPTPEEKECDNVAAPPPELDKVPEPVPPKEKSAMMHTVPAAQSSGTGGSSIATPSSTSNGPSGPQPAAPEPSAAWGSKKLGDW